MEKVCAWRRKRWPATAAAVLAVAIAAVFLLRDPLGDLLGGWTGEEEPTAQVKALGALGASLFQPARDTQPYAAIEQVGVNPYGVNTFLEQEVEEAKVRRSLEMVRDAGFGWIRQEFPWEDIEISAKGDFWDHQWDHSAWDKYDRIVDISQEMELEIIARLDNPPGWARSDPGAGDRAPPDDLGDYGDFVEAVVSRYKGRIRYYQIWNEPNIYPEWGEGPADPESYTALLIEGYDRAKAADPDCVVLAAGLAPTLETGPQNLNDLAFLERMYAAGAKDHFDIMSVMAYGLWTGPGDRRVDPERTNFSRPILIREIMVQHGDEHKPIWVSEAGWNAAPPGMEAPYGRVSEEQQAGYAVAAYRRANEEWPWMGVMCYWFFRRPADYEISQPFYYFRMVEPDFRPLPVYGALADAATQQPVLGPGFHQESHWALAYSSGWRDVAVAEASLGGLRTGSRGELVSFSFYGTGADLVTRIGPEGGSLLAIVDGGPAARLDLESPRETYGVHVPLAGDWWPGEHRVTLVVEDGAPAVDGVVVYNRTERVLGALALGLLGLGIAVAWALSLGRGEG